MMPCDRPFPNKSLNHVVIYYGLNLFYVIQTYICGPWTLDCRRTACYRLKSSIGPTSWLSLSKIIGQLL